MASKKKLRDRLETALHRVETLRGDVEAWSATVVSLEAEAAEREAVVAAAIAERDEARATIERMSSAASIQMVVAASTEVEQLRAELESAREATSFDHVELAAAVGAPSGMTPRALLRRLTSLFMDLRYWEFEGRSRDAGESVHQSYCRVVGR